MRHRWWYGPAGIGWWGLTVVLGGCVGLPPDPPPRSGTEGDESGSASTGTSTGVAESSGSVATGSGSSDDGETTAAPVCGNGRTEGDEECDLGPDNGGGGACTVDCELDQCGNGYLGPSEVCDGDDLDMATCESQGFESGALACGQDCKAYDTSGCQQCGNGVAEGTEICDGRSFQNGLSCDDYAPRGTTVSGGTLACEDCETIDISPCTFCGDDVLEGDEECEADQFGPNDCQTFAPPATVHSGGQLECSFTCGIDFSACTYCGDTMIEGDEQCEGDDLNGQNCISQGFADGGTLACSSVCTFDTSACQECGNGVREGDEDCDMADLGGADCSDLGAGFRGAASCDASCLVDYGACCLAEGESCLDSGECCSNNCAGAMMGMTCQP